MLIDPVLEIRPLPRPALPPDTLAAVAITSANAVPALAWIDPTVPVFAVGAATAAAARAAGRAEVHVAAGDGRALAALIAGRLTPDAGAILHLAGADIREGLDAHLVAAGFDYRRTAVYEAVPADQLAPAVTAAIRARRLGAALFYSPRSAAIWAGQITRLRPRRPADGDAGGLPERGRRRAAGRAAVPENPHRRRTRPKSSAALP